MNFPPLYREVARKEIPHSRRTGKNLLKSRRAKIFEIFLRIITSLLLGVSLGAVYAAPRTAFWRGTIRNAQGTALPGAQVELRAVEGDHVVYATADSNGAFAFDAITAGSYCVYVHWQQEALRSEQPLEIREGEGVVVGLESRWMAGGCSCGPRGIQV